MGIFHIRICALNIGQFAPVKPNVLMFLKACELKIVQNNSGFNSKMSKSAFSVLSDCTAIAALFVASSRKLWTERPSKSPATMNLRREIRDVLDKVSGGQIPELCHTVLTPAEREAVNPEPYTALRAMGPLYNDLPDNMRRGWLSALKKSGWGRPFIHDILGWKCSPSTFLQSEEPLGGVGGRPATNQQHKSAVNKHLRTLSNDITGRWVSSSNSPTGKIPARHMHVSLSQAYLEYPEKDSLSYEAFIKMRDPEFKLSARPSDMCEYCERRKVAGRTLAALRTSNSIDAELSDADLLDLFDDDRENLVYVNASICVEVDRHRFLCDMQRSYYYTITDSPPPSTLIIDMDWKRKVNLPQGPMGMSLDGYHSCQIAILGFGFYTSAGTFNFDAVSKTVTEDSHCSCQALKAAIVYLREHGILDIRTFPTVHVWSDAGKHFRCKETAHFVLHEMKQFCADNVHITLNFLVEKHGKMRRDGHFRTLQPYLDQYTAREIVCSAGELAKAIRFGHSNTKKFNDMKGKPTPHLIVYEHTIPVKGTYTLRTYELEHIQSHYCFGVDDARMYVSPLSSSALRININPRTTATKCEYTLLESKAKPKPPENQFLVRMGGKRQRRDVDFGPVDDWQLPE